MSGEEKRSRARSGEIHPVTLAAVNESALVLVMLLRSSSDEAHASKRHCSGENEEGTTILFSCMIRL
jgi:hypothetical protein